MLRQACRYALANRGHDIQNGTTGDHVKALPVKIGELTIIKALADVSAAFCYQGVFPCIQKNCSAFLASVATSCRCWRHSAAPLAQMACGHSSACVPSPAECIA